MCSVWGYTFNFCFTALLYVVIIINYYLAVFLLIMGALSSLVSLECVAGCCPLGADDEYTELRLAACWLAASMDGVAYVHLVAALGTL